MVHCCTPAWRPAGLRSFPRRSFLQRSRDMVDLRRRISIHEAGHVFVARKLRLPGCGGASVVLDNPHAVFPIDHGAASVCALMAGHAAEFVAFDGDCDASGCAVDRERWLERLDRLGYDDGGAALWDHTAALVRQNRSGASRGSAPTSNTIARSMALPSTALCGAGDRDGRANRCAVSCWTRSRSAFVWRSSCRAVGGAQSCRSNRSAAGPECRL